NTSISMEEDHGDLVVRKISIDNGEMTPLERNFETNTIVCVSEGAMELTVEDDYFELEKGDCHFIEKGEPHRMENIVSEVTEVIQVLFPYDPEDIEVLEDPYK
ncbi:MAG: cupin domain-containing protein, partial [Candidatus Nanohaloarchaea archaeon]|nr:cupin domain-containing protein [Candidatus Nanohaloarchaea archaeon]